jgi:hypothetical protein
MMMRSDTNRHEEQDERDRSSQEREAHVIQSDAGDDYSHEFHVNPTSANVVREI